MKILLLSLMTITISLWTGLESLAQGQLTHNSQDVILLGSAALGATLGGLAVESFELFRFAVGECSGSVSRQKIDERYGHDFKRVVSAILRSLGGPALAATASLVAVGSLYKLEGRISWSVLYSFLSLGAGLSIGCVFAGIVPVMEPFFSTVWPIQWAALGALVGYRPRERSFDQGGTSAPTMSVTLWSLRF